MEQLLQQNKADFAPSSGGLAMSEEDRPTSLDEQVGVIVPFVKSGLRRMLAEGEILGGWAREVISPREAEAAGFSWVKPLISKYTGKRLVKLFMQSAKRGEQSRESAVRMLKETLPLDIQWSRETSIAFKGLKKETRERFGVLIDQHMKAKNLQRVEPFLLPSKQTFQLENLKSLLKSEPAIRYKHLREKLPKLFPLLKSHGWQGEKLTVKQAERYLGGKKSLFAGRWGKWEAEAGETWIETEADRVLVVMPVHAPSELVRYAGRSMEAMSGHPPGYGWIRFKDVGDTRVISEIQSDIESSFFERVKMKRENLGRLQSGMDVEGSWGQLAAKENVAVRESLQKEISELKTILTENAPWKEDALSGLIMDARKKGLKKIFIPEMQNLPRHATKSYEKYTAYYKNPMKRVGGFKPGLLEGKEAAIKPSLKDPLVHTINVNTGGVELRASVPGLEVDIESPFGPQVFFNAIGRLRNRKITMPSADDVLDELNKMRIMFVLEKGPKALKMASRITHVMEPIRELRRKILNWKGNTGYIRPLSLALPLGLGVFTQND